MWSYHDQRYLPGSLPRHCFFFIIDYHSRYSILIPDNAFRRGYQRFIANPSCILYEPAKAGRPPIDTDAIKAGTAVAKEAKQVCFDTTVDGLNMPSLSQYCVYFDDSNIFRWDTTFQLLRYHRILLATTPSQEEIRSLQIKLRNYSILKEKIWMLQDSHIPRLVLISIN